LIADYVANPAVRYATYVVVILGVVLSGYLFEQRKKAQRARATAAGGPDGL